MKLKQVKKVTEIQRKWREERQSDQKKALTELIVSVFFKLNSVVFNERVHSNILIQELGP